MDNLLVRVSGDALRCILVKCSISAFDTFAIVVSESQYLRVRLSATKIDEYRKIVINAKSFRLVSSDGHSVIIPKKVLKLSVILHGLYKMNKYGRIDCEFPKSVIDCFVKCAETYLEDLASHDNIMMYGLPAPYELSEYEIPECINAISMRIGIGITNMSNYYDCEPVLYMITKSIARKITDGTL
jgi:hypothetical protein